MKRIGPELELLTHRLADAPPEFLAAPLLNGSGEVHVAALVNDLLFLHGGGVDAALLDPFAGAAAGKAISEVNREANRLALSTLCVWLLAHEWFVTAGCPQARLLAVLDGTARELARGAPAHAFATDPDRREELARVVLAQLDMRPAGETVEQATDRLSNISGAERDKLIAATRSAVQRAREVRDALARKAAQEAADKWTRD